MTTSFNDAFANQAVVDKIGDAVVTVLTTDATLTTWADGGIQRISVPDAPEDWAPNFMLVSVLSMFPIQELSRRTMWTVPVAIVCVWQEWARLLEAGDRTAATLLHHIISVLMQNTNYFLNVPPHNTNLINRILAIQPVSLTREDAETGTRMELTLEVQYAVEVDMDSQDIP